MFHQLRHGPSQRHATWPACLLWFLTLFILPLATAGLSFCAADVSDLDALDVVP